MVRTIHRIGLALALTVLVASAAMAQVTPRRGMSNGNGMMQGRGGPALMLPALASYEPQGLLDRATELALTAQQIDQLEALTAERERLVREARAGHDQSQEALRREVARPDVDESSIAQAFWAAHAAMGKLHWAEVHASVAAKAILTPEQRALISTDR